MQTAPVRRLLVLASVATAACIGTSAANAAQQRLPLPDALEIGQGLALAVPSTTTTLNELPARSFALWGGPYVTPSGETVNIRVSNSYVQDPAFAQQWANFLASLYHGAELSTLTLELDPLAEVQLTCGRFALACYTPGGKTIVASADDPDPTTTAESIIAHEYGHHFAASSNNAPWEAVDYGTKRWATDMKVCTSAASGKMYPGNEDSNYKLNPGEGFAEAYRVLNERHLGVPESGWDVVSTVFYPDTGALTALEQDVTTPWTTTTASIVKGSFSKPPKKKPVPQTVKSTALATPLDGDVTATLRTPTSLKARIDLIENGVRVGSATTAGGAKTVRDTVCGTRSYTVRVTRLAGSGSYSVTLVRP
jgi:hypothetical protein